MGLLDTTCRRSRCLLRRLLGGELFAGRLATGGLASGLLETRRDTRRQERVDDDDEGDEPWCGP